MEKSQKHQLMAEITEKSAMTQSIWDSLKILGEWEYQEKCVVLAEDLLHKAGRNMGKEIDKLQKELLGEPLDIEAALSSEPLEPDKTEEQ